MTRAVRTKAPPMGRRCRTVLAAILVLTGTLPASAHPLIHMHCRILFNFDGRAVNAFGQTWTFDEHYSGHLIEDFDTDGDSAFSPAEIAAMKKTVLPAMARRRTFTFVSVDGRDLGAIAPYTFDAAVKNGIVTFAMSMALPAPVDPGRNRLSVEIRDPGFSVEAVFADTDPVVLSDPPSPACAGDIAEGSVRGSEAVTLTCPAD